MTDDTSVDSQHSTSTEESTMRTWTVASDEDVTVGYMLADEDLPADPDALLGTFVVVAAREWDTVYDPNKLTLSARPARYRLDERQEALVPAGKRKADSRWWVISGLDDAEVRR